MVEEHGRLALLAELSAVLSEILDPVSVLRRAADRLIPTIADFCEIDLIGDDGLFHRMVAPSTGRFALAREAKPLALDADHPIPEVVRTGATLLLDIENPEHTELFGPPDDPTTAAGMGMRIAVITRLHARNEALGALSVGYGASRRMYTESDIDFIQHVARRIALGLDNARLFEHQRKLTTRLAEVVDRQTAIVRSIQDGLFVADRTGTILEVSPRWSEILGFSAENAVGQVPPFPWWPDADDHPVERRRLEAAVAEAREATPDTRIEVDVTYRRPDGSFVPVLLSVAPFTDAATGELAGLVGTVKDMTERVRSETRLRTLGRVTAGLASAASVVEVAEVAIGEVIPALGVDAGGIAIVDPDRRSLRSVGVGVGAVVGEWQEVDLDVELPLTAAIRSGRTIVVRNAAELAQRFPEAVDALAPFRIESGIWLPFPGTDRPRGALSLLFRGPHELDDDDLALAAALARQCGQALDRAQRHEADREAALTLQEGMLADSALTHPALGVAVRYLPAAERLRVGGDWYDVIGLADGRIGIAVGDVVGSGLHAAATMGQLRSALTASALSGAGPAAVLDAVDRFASRSDHARATTVVYAVFDPVAGTLTYSNAGHPPPMIVTVDGKLRQLEGARGAPLAVIEKERPEETVRLAPDATVVIYTDGLVERRGESLDTGLRRLRDALADVGGWADLEELCDEVIDRLVGSSERSDDIAVLCARLEGTGDNSFSHCMPARPAALAEARRVLRGWLDQMGATGDERDDLVLAVGEASANSIEHGYRGEVDGDVKISGSARDGVITLTVRDQGRWSAPSIDPLRGRGIELMAALTDSARVRPSASGTTVVLTRALSGSS